MPRVFISAGEASGDHYGAELMRATRARDAQLEFSGLAGKEMQALGCRAIVRAEDVAHMGITEVVRHAPFIYRQYQALKHWLSENKPGLAVLIDFPDVNFRLAKHCHALGIPVLWLVSPQLWAWKKRRLRWVQRWVTRMLVIFPFEEAFYKARGVDAEFIGHPLADLPVPAVTRMDYAARYGLSFAKPWIALLPGSRAREFAMHFSTMRRAAELLGSGYEFLVPLASTLNWQEYSAKVRDAGASARLVPVPEAREAMFHARASVVASGTATVQAALMGNPFVIVYRMSPVSFWLARKFVDVKFAGMPNLIAGREIVPELLQDNFTPQTVIAALRPMLEDGTARAHIQRELAEVRARLAAPALPNAEAKPDNRNSSTAMARAADAALSLLKRNL